MSNISQYLFETDAIKVCPENKPFWYTSGKIGPYYINAHFIYGNEEEANTLLKLIDNDKYDKPTLPKKVFDECLKHYNESQIYKDVIDQTISFIEENIDLNSVDYISGGERRDWFFSNIIANKLGKPHISIFKDLQVVINDSNFENVFDLKDLNGAKVLHIADLITEASSYIRAWIPAIQSLNARDYLQCCNSR